MSPNTGLFLAADALLGDSDLPESSNLGAGGLPSPSATFPHLASSSIPEPPLAPPYAQAEVSPALQQVIDSIRSVRAAFIEARNLKQRECCVNRLAELEIQLAGLRANP
jgi:hypothetical protein